MPDSRGRPADGQAVAEQLIADWKANPIPPDGMWEREFGSRTKPLQLSALNLDTIPDSLRDLANLELLILIGNRIRQLPAWIGELKALRLLDVTNNLLLRLPDELGQLSQLELLWLAENQLQQLPESLRALPLKRLELGLNADLDLPPSILKRSPQEILRYYFESRGPEGRRLQELKLLLVGRGKSGKTTLVKRLASEVPDLYEPETHSIAIRELTVACPRGDVQTRAWDFGGQDVLYSTHQFFLTGRSLYLLVLEPRTNLASRDAEYWLKLIETQGAGSPVIVVLNQSHDHPWRVDEVKLRRKFPFVVDFVSTDALEGDGIEKLRETIIRTVENMADVWLPFPNRWRAIKNVVAGMPDNFLTYNQYTYLCEKHDETRPDAQADLAQILHALGLALYFGNDPRLHDTRVLNPSWVTGGVYAVIRSPSVTKRNGQLALVDMPDVLREAEKQKFINAADYPETTHAFILELMRAFQLCYASEDEKGKAPRYLVPELLSEFEPKMDEAWEEALVRLRYRYDALPPGLLPRFNVRTHALSDGEPHWRHGVVLRHADARALIREESERPELHVFIIGNDNETRQLLVAMVRRELKTLHAEMRTQPVEELELSGGDGRWISVKALREVEEPQKPTQKLAVQPEGTAQIHVSQELDKLVPSEARAIDREPDTAPVPVRLFVCYASEDERQLKRLDLMLDVLELQHGLAPWIDKRLIAGDGWHEAIKHRLEEMDIFLFIASAASIVKPYIRKTELSRALERHAKSEIEIVTVKLEPCAYDEDKSLGRLQRLGSRPKSVAEVTPRSVAWEQVRKDLLSVIERVRAQKRKSA